jgi:hypothetical protein
MMVKRLTSFHQASFHLKDMAKIRFFEKEQMTNLIFCKKKRQPLLQTITAVIKTRFI